MKRWIGTCAAAALTALTAEAYDKAYGPTAPGMFEIKTAVMRFFAGPDAPAELPSTNGVAVEVLAQRVVASAGARGSYSEENVAATTRELRAWLAKQPDWIEAGPPRAAYWNGPFLPGFLKKYEVHISVKAADPDKKPAASRPARSIGEPRAKTSI
ncbi:MAG: hypothetical protein BWK77_04180 [Verrucomicrobia bacterium A1]|nr:MAG: hypothetical protein BWK77_04180 [Verrucomicrobia bacterium A1]